MWDCSSLENYVSTVSRCFGTQAIRLGRKDPYPRFAGSFHRLERYANCKRGKGQVSIPNVCVVRDPRVFLFSSSFSSFSLSPPFFFCLKVILFELSFFLGDRWPPSPLFNFACQIEKARPGTIERSLTSFCVMVMKEGKTRRGRVTNIYRLCFVFLFFFFPI